MFPLYTRRRLLKHGMAASAVAALPTFPSSLYGSRVRSTDILTIAPADDAPITDDPRVKQMIQSALDAATSTGAAYADVRLTHTRRRVLGMDSVSMVDNGTGSRNLQYQLNTPRDQEEITVGVRALVKGYWGFAAGPVWTLAEGERLGREAARQAKTNSLGKSREMSLAPTEPVTNGSWTMPAEVDPFTVHPSQLKDILRGLAAYAVQRPHCFNIQINATFLRQDKAFGSNAGSYFTQRTYGTFPLMRVQYVENPYRGAAMLPILTDVGMGFEIFDERRVREAIDPCLEELAYEARFPVVPLDVGRYETVMDASAVASMLSGTIGAATELDRALGFEANAGGTSYLNDPAAMLGREIVGSKLVSVTADRSEPGALATVKWDDEGVMPTPVPLITNGMLTNYQTTREGAAWVASAKPGTAARSAGCAFAPVGVDAPLTHTANLRMHPGNETQDFDSLIRGMKKGIACKGMNVELDFQQLNGFGGGSFYEVTNGKRVARIAGAGIMFRSPEFWKGVRAIGGEASQISFGQGATKGEPPQASRHTVTAVPLMHEGLSYFDPTRKA